MIEVIKGDGVIKSLSWQDVFNGGKKFHGDIQFVYKLALESGYDFFTYNERVFLIENGSFRDTHVFSDTLV